MTCKGTNCTASKANDYRHSSECLFEYARAIASGVKEVRCGVTLGDSMNFVEWHGHKIDLAEAVTRRDLMAELLEAATRVRVKRHIHRAIDSPDGDACGLCGFSWRDTSRHFAAGESEASDLARLDAAIAAAKDPQP